MRAIVAACVLAIGAGAASRASGQAVMNGSFEDPDTSGENAWGDRAAHWGRWGNWMNRESGWQPTHSGACLLGYHHWEIAEDATSGAYQDIPNTPANKVITFTIYATKDEKTNADALELRLEPLNGGEALGSRVYSMGELQAGTWNPLSVDAKVPSEGVRILVIATPKAGALREGALKFDDAMITVE